MGIDSRQDLNGRLFVALPGERHDGHDFAASARDQGAAALMVQRPLAIDLPQWQVEDTRLALGQLAAAHRDRFAGRVVALTGSNGKTTTKEMIAAILGQVGRVRATRGNLNNDIGLPLTLLEAGEEDFLVLEMGANHPGEIAYLTGIARPEVAAITNAGRAHLEGFGSLAGVARAKGEIVAGLRQDGIFIFPADSPWTGLWRELAGARTCLTCGPAGAADLSVDLTAVETRWDEAGFRTSFQVTATGQVLDLELALAGTHNVRNALVAVAMAHALGIAPEAIAAGLAAMRPVPGRLFPRRVPGGARLIDDSYNANPDSVEAAIAVLMSLPGRHLLVLGDLGELGPEAARTPSSSGSCGPGGRDRGPLHGWHPECRGGGRFWPGGPAFSGSGRTHRHPAPGPGQWRPGSRQGLATRGPGPGRGCPLRPAGGLKYVALPDRLAHPIQ